ncbi:profilin [Streptomyces goshikiensis]|uniref:profilin n=1 Tax=Streptomyces goshikiensis TaxID=1942 RepID=UPI00364BB5A0
MAATLILAQAALAGAGAHAESTPAAGSRAAVAASAASAFASPDAARPGSASERAAAMDWQKALDDLANSGKVTWAAILDPSGAVRVATPGPGLRPGEGPAAVKAYNNPANVFSSGLTLWGVKFFGIKADERSIYLKKGATGAAVVRTAQSAIVAHYDETKQPGPAYDAVEKAADRVIPQGF